MEATSDYRKPFYYLLEDAGFELMLVNARHVKNLPGRRSDVSDATWLAHDYLERALLPGRSFTGPDDFNAQLAGFLNRASLLWQPETGAAHAWPTSLA
jgi:transposase